METKKILWYNLAFMAFSTVWGFGNVLNGFVYFNGLQVIFSWVLMFALYFVPYALMVGELGSAFKDSGGGVSSWIHETIGSKSAYYAGWTYWACHITYIASKASGGLKALSQATSWAFMPSGQDWYDGMDTVVVQALTMVVFLFFCWIASRGLNPLKKLTTLAGTSMFIMSILYIIMMFAAPVINPDGGFQSLDFSWENIIPQFNVNYFTSLGILVFAVGGCEKISPYVNKVKDPAKGFPKGMIALAIMVMVCAILGTVAMGMMFNVNDVMANQDAYISNGAYWAFEKLGAYYGIGDSLKIIYSICNAIGQFSTLVLSIDAPLRMSADLEGTPGCKIIGPKGEITVDKGVIVAKRHAHFTPDDAKVFGVTDGQAIQIKLDYNGRSLIFGDVIARVSKTAGLAVHIDTDEANAAGLTGTVDGEAIIG